MLIPKLSRQDDRPEPQIVPTMRVKPVRKVLTK